MCAWSGVTRGKGIANYDNKGAVTEQHKWRQTHIPTRKMMSGADTDVLQELAAQETASAITVDTGWIKGHKKEDP